MPHAGFRHSTESRQKMSESWRKRNRLGAQDRFWGKVDKKPGHGPWGDCWVWLNSLHGDGYGAFYFQGKLRNAHIVSYFFKHREFPPDGLELDHLCRIHRCVNPDHLEPVTRRENTLRGEAASINRSRMLARTHCKNGHPFTEGNFNLLFTGTGTKRECKECKRIKAHRYIEKNRSAINTKRKEQRWQAKQLSK